MHAIHTSWPALPALHDMRAGARRRRREPAHLRPIGSVSYPGKGMDGRAEPGHDGALTARASSGTSPSTAAPPPPGSSAPSRCGLAAQAEDAWREERDADHLAEDRAVLVPADAGAGAVFGQQHLLQRGGLEAGEGGGALAQGQEERWDVLGRLDLHQVEIVAPAERDDAALAEEALEFEGPERQLGEAAGPVHPPRRAQTHAA